jgi:hypothetical protein
MHGDQGKRVEPFSGAQAAGRQDKGKVDRKKHKNRRNEQNKETKSKTQEKKFKISVGFCSNKKKEKK